jgi:hypothetical protein
LVTRFLSILVALGLWLSTVPALAESDVHVLVHRLKTGEDFRVRVAAALELGRSKTGLTREPLEAALDDENAAVRAAAAAALKVLGDARALPALREHSEDPSSAVRAQIKASILALQKSGSSSAPVERTRVLVKIGKMKNGSGVGSSALVDKLEQTSRQKFMGLPGVEVVGAQDDVNAQAKKETSAGGHGHRQDPEAQGCPGWLGRRVFGQCGIRHAPDARPGLGRSPFQARPARGRPRTKPAIASEARSSEARCSRLPLPVPCAALRKLC